MDNFIEKFWGIFLSAIAFCLVGYVITVITLATRADGRISHCLITYYQPSNYAPGGYLLQGYRQWRENVTIGYYNTYEEAQQKLKDQCPVK
jgi:hypothetical protein